ncbi:hypothetical protein FIV42_05735 [Persicimonas caeni]|uniref:Uncharacterized protein n=1 Tax=Persicimonas caeni TaxID=2292766 RepID=A0A4Y6PPK3_PERCE|nr:hypothetical protein [Persicimonas caeni]QDG50248.1 hypothetical protein FIV42_05735 [Persicimonas caeni]QED31469.1 hypothetical protein FRD00_05730 [Persicimonas caeni]
MSTSPRNNAVRFVCLVAVTLGWLGFAPAEAGAQDQFVEPGELAEDYEPREGLELDRPLELDITFDYLHVARKDGDIAVAYQVADSDWKRVRRHNITLWVSIYIPSETTPPTLSYSYHLPLDDGRTGLVEFPEWLSTLHVDELGVCVLGTKPYDNLGLGRGYACNELLLAPVHRRLQQRGDGVRFELTYYGGMPYYGYFPWRGPFL